MIRGASRKIHFAIAKRGGEFCGVRQRFESVRRFEMQNRCDISDNGSKKIHNSFTIERGKNQFSNKPSPLCR
jgi:hypothetical protein